MFLVVENVSVNLIGTNNDILAFNLMFLSLIFKFDTYPNLLYCNLIVIIVTYLSLIVQFYLILEPEIFYIVYDIKKDRSFDLYVSENCQKNEGSKCGGFFKF